MYQNKFQRRRQSSYVFSLDFIPTGLMFILAFAIPLSMKHLSIEQSFWLKIDYPNGTVLVKPVYGKNTAHLYISAALPSGSGSCLGAHHMTHQSKFLTIQDLKYALPSYQCPKGKYCAPKVIIHADKDVEMGLIGDIKKELSRLNWVYIHYVQTAENEES